jgi:hypothetical protein
MVSKEHAAGGTLLRPATTRAQAQVGCTDYLKSETLSIQ